MHYLVLMLHQVPQVIQDPPDLQVPKEPRGFQDLMVHQDKKAHHGMLLELPPHLHNRTSTLNR
jgi:hypothetical protein